MPRTRTKTPKPRFRFASLDALMASFDAHRAGPLDGAPPAILARYARTARHVALAVLQTDGAANDEATIADACALLEAALVIGDPPGAAMRRDAARWIALARTTYGGGVTHSTWHDVATPCGYLDIVADDRLVLTLTHRRRRLRLRLVRTAGPAPAPRQRSILDVQQRSPVITCRAKRLTIGPGNNALVLPLPNAGRWLIQAHLFRDHVALVACPAPKAPTPHMRLATD